MRIQRGDILSKEIESLLIKIISKEESKETCTCDICGRQIYKRSLKASEELPENHFSIPFYKASTWHGDWGNDSSDSFESYDICSAECLSELFSAYGTASGKCDRNTWGIEVNHDYTLAYEGNGEKPKTPKKYGGYLMRQGGMND